MYDLHLLNRPKMFLFNNTGEKYVAWMYNNDAKLKDIVRYLREGWYGNGEKFHVGHPLRKRGFDYRALWRTWLKIAGTKYVGLCDGISGEIGSLNVDENYVEEEVDLPIDTLVTDLTNEDNEVDEFNMNESV